jgi:hypothetical protein
MHPVVEQLVAVLVPPEDVASDVAGDVDWGRAVDVLGTALPQDYRDFLGRYGGGVIDN